MIRKELLKCNTVAELARALHPFSANCPITPLKLTYEYDYPNPAKIIIQIDEINPQEGEDGIQ